MEEDRKLFGSEDGTIYTREDRFPPEHRAWEHVRSYRGAVSGDSPEHHSFCLLDIAAILLQVFR